MCVSEGKAKPDLETSDKDLDPLVGPVAARKRIRSQNFLDCELSDFDLENIEKNFAATTSCHAFNNNIDKSRKFPGTGDNLGENQRTNKPIFEDKNSGPGFGFTTGNLKPLAVKRENL
jgi:hypothetical protein